MTDHLPECGYSPGQPGFGGINSGIPSTQPYLAPSPCICDELRACEQRVLDAAREAVYGLASDMANWSSAETAAATSAVPDLSVDQWMWAQRGVYRALAAIDALRGGA